MTVETGIALTMERCFTEARARGQETYSRPEQAKWREQLSYLLQAIFTSDNFSKLSPGERIAFYDDYTNGVIKLLLTGDCQPLFDDMEEWYEYLEEVADYEEFEAELKEECGVRLGDLKLA
ncbi:MAG: hypothetical protein J7M16_06850 [Anaerolineae bacterium]|nr:hypothetical protein [Anaerolineae bacterium]